MKYQNETKETKTFAQSFSEFVDNYQLILREDKLYKSETPINRQELIESSRELALNNALEKFLPKEVTEDNETVVEYNNQQTDLDLLMEAENVANEYRKKFNLPDSFTTSQVYDFVNKQSILLKEHIDKALVNVNKSVEKPVDGGAKNATQESK